MALYGLRVKHPSTGAVILEITDRITRVLGSLSTGVSSGSFTVPSGLGDAFFICSVATTFDAMQTTPQISVSGNTISWTFSVSPGYSPAPIFIQYGVY